MTEYSIRKIKPEAIPQYIEDIASKSIRCALDVHTALGPGLLEKVYETCLKYELQENGFEVTSQVRLPVNYKNNSLKNAYRLDLLVENCFVIEIKTVEKIRPLHQAQLLTYLKLSGYRLGFIFNFNTVHLKDGMKRVVSDLEFTKST